MKFRVVQQIVPGMALAAGLFASVLAIAQISKMDVPDIGNFTRVDNRATFAGNQAGFGGATAPTAMDWLREQGFATVINLRLATEDNANIEHSRIAAREAGLHYINLPLDPNNPAPGFMDDFLATAGDSSMQPVYIHCGSGTRAAAVWMIARVTEDGLEVAEAEVEARQIAEKPEEALQFFTAYMASQGR